MIHRNVTTQPSPHVQNKRAQRKRDILRVTLTLIEDRGIDTLKMTDIAQAMDWRVGALYRYYPSRDAIEVDLQRVILIGLRKSGLTLVKNTRRLKHALSPLIETAGLCLHYAAFSSAYPWPMAVLGASLALPRFVFQDDDAKAVAHDVSLGLIDLSRALESTAAAGLIEHGSAPTRALSLWSALHGVSLTGKLNRFAPSHPSAIDLSASLLTAIMVGWGAKASHVKTAVNLVTNPQVMTPIFDIDAALAELSPGGL